VNQSLIAKKTVALLHDPVIKALLLAGAKINGIEGDKEDEHCRAVARYMMSRFVDKIREKKTGLASAIEKEIESWWNGKGEVEEANGLLVGSEGAFTEAVFAKPVNKVFFMNVLDKHTLNLDELMERACKNLLDEFIEELAEVYSTAKDGFEFHALWRALLSTSAKKFTEKASLLPADTRTPFVTIYDHLYTTSALTTCLTEGNPAIMVFEAKRIQEFISSSRALRDFWASSYLMSIMTLYVIGRLSEEFGPDIFIKPCLLGVPLYDLWLRCKGALNNLKSPSLYKIIAPVIPAQVVMLAPAIRCEDIASKVLEYYRDAWLKVLEAVKDFIKDVLDEKSFRKHSEKCLYGKSLEELWKQAEEPPFEVQVTWVEVPKDKDERRAALKKLVDDGLITVKLWEELNRLAEKVEGKDEKILFELPLFERAAVRKASLAGMMPRISRVSLLRAPLEVSHRDGTCTLCWHQPAVLTRPRNPQSITTIKKEKLGVLKEGERLCPSCLVKRFFGTREVFTQVMKSLIGDVAGEIFEKSLEKYNPPAFSKILPIASTDTVSSITFKLTAIKLAVKNKQVLGAVESFVVKVDELVNEAYPKASLFVDPFYPCKAVESLISALSQRRDVLLKFAYLNGWYLHERGLREFEEYGVDREKVDEAVSALKKLRKSCEASIKSLALDPCAASVEPNLYVAIVRADGDDMGQLISLSGNFKVKIRDLIPRELFPFVSSEEKSSNVLELAYVAGPSHLMATSRTLSSLAMEVYETCYLCGAIPVYCGGDDLLIISPPEVALVLSVSLREKFSTTIRNISDDAFGVKVLMPGLGRKATQSYVIRFIHFLAPLTLELGYSLEQLEEKAKARDRLGRKDGLVITYKPRGAQGLEARLKWTVGCSSPSRLASFMLTCASLAAEFPKAFDFSVKEGAGGERTFTVGVEVSGLRLSKQAFRNVWAMFSDILDLASLSTIVNYQFKRHSSGDDERVMVKLKEDVKSLADLLELEGGERVNVLVEALKSVSALVEASNVSVWGESL